MRTPYYDSLADVYGVLHLCDPIYMANAEIATLCYGYINVWITVAGARRGGRDETTCFWCSKLLDWEMETR